MWNFIFVFGALLKSHFYIVLYVLLYCHIYNMYNLLIKVKGQLWNERPITLLNADYKLLAHEKEIQKKLWRT